jgi:hypothetical protein
MIMTENKAQKTAIRERMARTGEPYSVARRAVLSGHVPSAGPAGSWPKWVPKPWNEEIPDSKPWDEEIPEGRPWDEEIPEDSFAGDQPWLAQYFADGAATEGISVPEFKARMASPPGQRWAGEVPVPHDPDEGPLDEDPLDEEAAQEQAGRAGERADAAQEQADEAQERAGEAQGQAEEAADRAGELRDLADEARDRIAGARELVEEARHEGDEGMLEDARQQAAEAKEEAAHAERAAQRAAREAQRAQDQADRAQVRADMEQERADRAQEAADQVQEWADAFPGGHGHPRARRVHLPPVPGGGRPPWWFPGRAETRRHVSPAQRPAPPAPPPLPAPPPPPGR